MARGKRKEKKIKKAEEVMQAAASALALAVGAAVAIAVEVAVAVAVEVSVTVEVAVAVAVEVAACPVWAAFPAAVAASHTKKDQNVLVVKTIQARRGPHQTGCVR